MLDNRLNDVAGHRSHNHSPLDFEKLKGAPDNTTQPLVSYIKGFSKNVRDILDFFESRRACRLVEVGPCRIEALREVAGIELINAHPAAARRGVNESIVTNVDADV